MAEFILAKTLLIIGAGIEQVPVYEAAKKRGLLVVGTDISLNAPAFKIADFALVASTRDPEATLKEVLKFTKTHTIDGVMTVANDVPYTVAKVAISLGLPSISINSAKLVSNKLLMKQKFKEFGVACPNFYSIKELRDLTKELELRTKEQFVLKPIDGRGARGVLLLDESTNLAWAFNESQSKGDGGELILEEFISGTQLSTESFIIDGECYTPAIAERNYSRLKEFAPNIIEDGGTIPADLNDQQIKDINNLILKGAKALGVHQGVVKGDLVITEKGIPMIIELALRLSGGWFATHQIPAATGVDLVDIVISYSLGEDIDRSKLQSSWQKATAIRYWFPMPGFIKKIVGERAIKNIPGLIKYGFFFKEGDMQPAIKMHSDRFGYVIVEGDSKKEALSRVDQAISSLKVEIN
jgi:biotin carboxylase